MAKRRYLIDKDPSKELMLRWNSGWRSTEVFWNQEQIAGFDKKQILSGASVELPDGGTLELQLEKGIFAYLSSKINGKHIPNSMGDPKYMFRQIFLLLLVLGIINLAVGLALAFMSKDVDLAELGLLNAALGALEILLGYGILKEFYPALIITVIFIGADMVMTSMYSGENSIGGGVFIKLFFLIFILRGFKAFKEKRRIEAEGI
ncbi:MAG: hypothetical protein JXR53_10640 [Bacteroidales bacterium]|nr:hypothetical protein [Bacteroidales bacterium]